MNDDDSVLAAAAAASVAPKASDCRTTAKNLLEPSPRSISPEQSRGADSAAVAADVSSTTVASGGRREHVAAAKLAAVHLAENSCDAFCCSPSIERHSAAEDYDDSRPMNNILTFCNLLNKLKHLPRTGWLRYGIDKPEAVAGHMYRMAVLAFCLDDKTDAPNAASATNGVVASDASCKSGSPATATASSAIDRCKCIKMALVHDLAESIVGDITPYCGVSAEEKFRREHEGMQKIASLLPSKVGVEMYELWREYESQTSREARLVKQLDRFDLMAQAFEYERQLNKPRLLDEFFNSANNGCSSKSQAIVDEPMTDWFKQLLLERQRFNDQGGAQSSDTVCNNDLQTAEASAKNDCKN